LIIYPDCLILSLFLNDPLGPISSGSAGPGYDSLQKNHPDALPKHYKRGVFAIGFRRFFDWLLCFALVPLNGVEDVPMKSSWGNGWFPF
jgi:hypothetical protein